MPTHHFCKDMEDSLGYYTVSDMRWNGDGKEIQAYQRIDLRVAKTFQFAANEGAA